MQYGTSETRRGEGGYLLQRVKKGRGLTVGSSPAVGTEKKYQDDSPLNVEGGTTRSLCETPKDNKTVSYSEVRKKGGERKQGGEVE